MADPIQKIASQVSLKTSLVQFLRALFCDLPQRGGSTTPLARGVGFAIVLVLAIKGFAVGSQSYLENQNKAQFYQGSFGPAVSIACTGHISSVTGNKAVDAFLHDPNGRLESCEGVDAARSIYWTVMDTASLYLYVLAAISWVFLGFSWSSLSAVAGLFAAGYALGAYLVARCFTSSRLLAYALALAALYAPVVLGQMPHLRDFSKAPLILLGLGLIGRVVLSAASFRRAMFLAGTAGAVIGLGRGLRPDALALVPIALTTFALLWPKGDGWRRRTRQVLCAVLALFVGYFVASAPIAIVNGMKHNPANIGAHVLLLGLAEPFQDALGFERGNYALVRDYVDEHVQSLVNFHHFGVGAAPMEHSLDPAYGPASYALFIGMLGAAPHDVLMRVFATANSLGAYPLNNLIYGPLLILLLVVGFILLPRRALFYVVSAAVMVPILSLQFHQRHAFYAVIFGAAALGLAYTLAAMTIAAVLGRGTMYKWPNRAKILTRAAVLAGSAVSISAFVYAADRFAIGRQEQALTVLLNVYRNADWAPIEMLHTDSELRFPTLQATPGRNVGVMALSFTFTDPEPTVGLIRDINWQGVGAASVSPHGDGLTLNTNGAGGYQLISRPIRFEEMNPLGDSSAPGTLLVRMRGKSLSRWTFGALSHDQSRWVDTREIGTGAFDRRVTLHIPRTEPAIQIVWEESLRGHSYLELDQLIVSNSLSLQGCAPTAWSIAPMHFFAGQSRIGTSIPIPRATSGTYYFPFVQIPGWTFESVKVDGALARCVTDARVAKSLPVHTVPIEMVEVDGAFKPSERETWGVIFGDFARWQRPATY